MQCFASLSHAAAHVARAACTDSPCRPSAFVFAPHTAVCDRSELLPDTPGIVVEPDERQLRFALVYVCIWRPATGEAADRDPPRWSHADQLDADAWPEVQGDVDVHFWGCLPVSTWLVHKGRIEQRSCESLDTWQLRAEQLGRWQALNRRRMPTPSFADLFVQREAGAMEVNTKHLRSFGLDEAEQLMARRVSGALTTGDSEFLSYTLLLHAAAYVSAFQRTMHVDHTAAIRGFLKIEERMSTRSLALRGGHAQLAREAWGAHAAKRSSGAEQFDVLEVDVLDVCSMLRGGGGLATGASLSRGRLQAPAATFTLCLLPYLRAQHERNLGMADAVCRSAFASRDNKLRALFLAVEPLLLAAGGVERPRRALDTIRDVQRLYEAMPRCVRELHERAVGHPQAEKARGHLRYNERKLYFSFLLFSGVEADGLVNIMDRAGHDDKYWHSIDIEIKGWRNWRDRLEPGAIAFGCKSLVHEKICPYSVEQGVILTKGQAQNRCQQFRASVLKRTTTDAHTGSPVMFAQQLRADLDAQLVIEQAAAAAATAAAAVHIAPCVQSRASSSPQPAASSAAAGPRATPPPAAASWARTSAGTPSRSGASTPVPPPASALVRAASAAVSSQDNTVYQVSARDTQQSFVPWRGGSKRGRF